MFQRLTNTISAAALLLSVSAIDSRAAGTAALVSSPEPGWAQWRGPRRDAVCQEAGLLGQWPKDGPELLWSVDGLGHGYSAPIITGNRIYLTGDEDGQLHLFALDLEGDVQWRTTNGASWKQPYPGARACPTYRSGRLFHLNAHGRLVCLDATDGRELWNVDVIERFEAKNLTWALSECLVVDKGRVYVTPGGSKGLMAALDAETGRTIWSTPPLMLGESSHPRIQTLAKPAGEPDRASYASPLPIEFNGQTILVTCSLRHFVGVNAENGELLWARPMPTRFEVIAATPVLMANAIFVTAPDAGGGFLYDLVAAEGGADVRLRYRTALDTCHGGVIGIGDSLFGTRYRSKKGWVCLDAATGEERYDLPEVAMGSMLHADGRLYALSQEGLAMLLEPQHDRFVVQGQFQLVTGHDRDVWTHPVIHQGRLYLRYHNRLFCFNVRK